MIFWFEEWKNARWYGKIAIITIWLIVLSIISFLIYSLGLCVYALWLCGGILGVLLFGIVLFLGACFIAWAVSP